jgi:putative transposase
VMPNHWHLVVGPTDSKTVSRLLHWVTTTHATRWHLHRKSTGTGPVYQGRFWMSVPDSSTELIRICRYVERNALRAELVRRAQDWPWGSLAERLRGDEQRLPLAPIGFLCSPTWVDYVNVPRTSQELVAKRKTSVAACPPSKRRDLSPAVENRYVPLVTKH